MRENPFPLLFCKRWQSTLFLYHWPSNIAAFVFYPRVKPTLMSEIFNSWLPQPFWKYSNNCITMRLSNNFVRAGRAVECNDYSLGTPSLFEFLEEETFLLYLTLYFHLNQYSFLMGLYLQFCFTDISILKNSKCVFCYHVFMKCYHVLLRTHSCSGTVLRASVGERSTSTC